MAELKTCLLLGDCLDLLKDLPDGSIDLTVTSPPYGNLRTYNGNISQWSFEKFQQIAKELYRVTADGGVVVWIVADAPTIVPADATDNYVGRKSEEGETIECLTHFVHSEKEGQTMTDFIRREDAKVFVRHACYKKINPIDYLDEVPAADVRPVVTCGKCKYGKYTGVSWFCDKHSGHADKFGEDASYHEYHSKHWFCADGEERNHA